MTIHAPANAVDIHDLVEQVCDRLGLKASYVYRLDIEAGGPATVHLYKGREGRCKGDKYYDHEAGEAATEVVTVPVIA